MNSTKWQTIDGGEVYHRFRREPTNITFEGMSRLPLAFAPLVANSTTFNRPIEKV